MLDALLKISIMEFISSGTTTYALSAIPSSGYKFYKWEKIIGGVTTHLSTVTIVLPFPECHTIGII